MKLIVLGIATLLAAPAWAQTTAPTRPAIGPSNPAVTRPANPPAPVPFGKLDANHDDTLSQDELRADATLQGVKFNDIDTNSDGKISADELATWQRKEKTSSTPKP